MVKHCQICGCELTTERKWCESCRRTRKREYAKQHYKDLINQGIAKIRYGKTNCIYCGKEIIKNRPDQNTCYDCYKKHRHKTDENYNNVKRSSASNTIGRQIIIDLGFKLNTNMCVHHINENPNDNKLLNLMIISRKNHAHIHRILEKNWLLLSKDKSINLENCWNILRSQLTTAYLETKGTNVIKITNIEQSAAESLNEDYIYIFDIEKGSEITHQVPKSNTHDESTVQTQTIM